MKAKMLTTGGIILCMFASVFLTPAPQVAGLECAVLPDSVCGKANEAELEKSGTWALLILIINILSGLVAIVAVAFFVWAGYLYTTAADKTDQVMQSKQMMISTSIGLVLYVLMFAIINYLVPGGLLS